MGQTMPYSPEPDVDEREAWVLRLLYAPNENGTSSPIYGKTRIVKGMFLLQRKLKENFETDAGFEFEAHKYGPFDPSVYSALERLERTEKIRTQTENEHGTKYNGVEYSLTPEGKQDAQELYNSLSAEKQELVKWVKYKQLMRSLGALLSYVYMEYPKMTEESELV